MLDNEIVLNNGTADQTFRLVSRTGMDSVRRNVTTGVPSSANAKLVIKHTIDEKSKTKPNRHLVSVTQTSIDANGKEQTTQVHFVITRAKNAPDEQVLEDCAILAEVLGDAAIIGQLMIGEN